jgi:hypothetical protein
MADGLNASQQLSSLNEAVIFGHNNVKEVGRIVEVHGSNEVSVVLFKTVSEELLMQYSLPSITAADYPCAVKSGMVELIEIAEQWNIWRSNIYDIAFIVPLCEVESCLFHLSGALNTFLSAFNVTVMVTSMPTNIPLYRPEWLHLYLTEFSEA